MDNAKSPPHGIRGSQKLLQGLAKNADVPSVEDIKKALGFTPNLEVKVAQWLTRGIPPAYLELDATFEVAPTNLAEVVDRIVRLNDSALGLQINTHGIPVPELAQVRVFNTPER
jgi:hypothetical protein